MMWRIAELEVVKIIIGALAFAAVAAVVVSAALFVVGETVEHFTPGECPPFDQCTPRGDWNAKNCKCWDNK